MSAPENPPAFPFSMPETEKYAACDHTGMTMRDYFAGQALPALIAAAIRAQQPETGMATVAMDAFAVADAMLAERAKRTEGGT